LLPNPFNVIVVGGGAAGFFAAIACAEANPHARVTILEAGKKPLAKVRISGGGRCNVTHHCFDSALFVQNYPRGGKALRGAFTRFQAKDTVEWFASRGVKLKVEADGRMFPVTDSSQTVIDCLRNAAKNAGVALRTGVKVEKLEKAENNGFTLRLKTAETLTANCVLLATGSNPSGYRWASSLGHKLISPVPSLFTFDITDPRLQDLAGISVETVSLRLLETGKQKLEQTGPLLITHWGISGPAVLKLSAWGARVLRDRYYRMPLQINWLPEHNSESLRQYLLEVKTQQPKRKIATNCPFNLPKRFWQKIVDYVGIHVDKPWAELANKELSKLIQELTQGQYQIQGKGVFKEEFVTCGGVNLKEINFKTMESRCCPGLYFAGEILDIDGVTGGFNFQSAWTTGWIAGQAMGIMNYEL
jgi:predicted Rossmann fold flavoprotein